MTELKKTNNINSIHYLRILACFLVVANHTNGIIPEYFPEYTNSYLLLLYQIIVKVAVPIFFMISGALLLNKDYSYKEIFKKAFKRLVLPLFICSLIIFFKRTPILSISNIWDFFKAFLANQILVPYWFLYTLLGLYLITPFLRKCVKALTKVDYKVYIVLSVLLLTIIPLINHYNIVPQNKDFYIGFITTHTFYYIFGYFIYWKFKKIEKNKFIIISSLILLLVLIMPFIIKFDINHGFDGVYWQNLGSVPVLLLSVLLVYFFGNYVNNEIKIKPISAIINNASSNTFYVYLIHGVLIGHTEFIFLFLINKLSINAAISLIIYQLLFFIILNVLAYIIRLAIMLCKKGILLWQKRS